MIDEVIPDVPLDRPNGSPEAAGVLRSAVALKAQDSGCGGRRPGRTLEADVVVRSLADLPPDAFDRLVPP